MPKLNKLPFIKTDDKLKCQNFLSDPEVRKIISNTFKKDCNIAFTRKGIELRKTLKPPKGKMMAFPHDLIKEDEVAEVLKETGFYLLKHITYN